MEFQKICNEMVAPFLLRHPVCCCCLSFWRINVGYIDKLEEDVTTISENIYGLGTCGNRTRRDKVVGASICFQHYEGPKSFPSPPVTSPFLLFSSILLSSFSLPLEVAPLIQLGCLGNSLSYVPRWGLGRSPSRQRFWCILKVKERCWWHSRCTVSNNRKLLLIFYEEIFKELTIAFILISVVTLLWGSKP